MTKKKEKKIDWENLEPEEKLKYEIAEELGLLDRVKEEGWKSLSAKETGRIGGLMTRRRREKKAREEKNSLEAFCRIGREEGFELYPMEVVVAGEEFYASMRRSTNGGGENSPKLAGEDDFYELFLAAL